MEITNLTKTFKHKDKLITAVNQVNLSFPKGKITGLIGYNGSGKTTIFNLILGFIEKDQGEVKVKTQVVDHHERLKFSFIARSDEFNRDANIMHNIKNIGYLYGLTKAEIVAKVKTLAKLFEVNANLKKDTFKKISKGNAQKIALIQALLNPFLEYLFLDEPFDGLDPIITQKVVNYLKTHQSQCAIIVTSHRLDVVESMVDAFYVIKAGKIVFNSAQDTLTQNLKVSVNPEVNEKNIQADFIQKVYRTPENIIFEIKSPDDFAALSKLLVQDPNYQIHNIIQTKLTEQVFKEYQND